MLLNDPKKLNRCDHLYYFVSESICKFCTVNYGILLDLTAGFAIQTILSVIPKIHKQKRRREPSRCRTLVLTQTGVKAMMMVRNGHLLLYELGIVYVQLVNKIFTILHNT